MAVDANLIENYKQLQQSTGEKFSDMADRIESTEAQTSSDALGRQGAAELAKELRKLSDDHDAIARHQARGGEPDKAPQGRNAGGKQTNG